MSPRTTEKASTVEEPRKDYVNRIARREQGKELRKTCPRISHVDIGIGKAARDSVALLEHSNHGRVPQLLPVRFTRMMESSFAFFRGTASLQAHDLHKGPSTGLMVQCCGDCHLLNFGGYATPGRTLVFDINDFDETHEGPFEWDLKRLMTSFVLAARWRSFSEDEARVAAKQTATAYRNTIMMLSTKSVLENWYARITFEEILELCSDDPAMQKRLKKLMKKARENTSDQVFEKITTDVNGTPSIVVQPPLLFRSERHDESMRDVVTPFFNSYRATLPRDLRTLFDRYRIVDVAFKVVGVGSVGTRCYVALLMDDQDEPLFLQVKEARQSVLAPYVETPIHSHDGERVVCGQRMMQSASDIFLGWARGPQGRTYYVRQLRDMKCSANISSMTPPILASYGRLCGSTLARAHARTGDAAKITGYMGSSEAFDDALTTYAIAYSDLVEQDFKAFQTAVRAGRFPIETVAGDLEQAIR